jgi:acyl-coenzyme A thioesterase PaaI-like protein
MNRVLSMYQRLRGYPLGKRIFSKLVCINAPYFDTVKPLFRELKPGEAVVTMKKRRRVTNHLGSVHAIAMCNISELAAGTMVEVSLGREFRWIPKSMNVEYEKIAKSDLTAVASVDVDSLNREQDIVIPVSLTDVAGTEVFRAAITMYISKRS